MEVDLVSTLRALPDEKRGWLDAKRSVQCQSCRAVMGRAANLGGDIRHPEIASAGATAAPAGDPNRFVAAAITQVAVYSHWAWPAAETVHFLGLSLSLAVLLAVNLRILGVLSNIPFADVHRLLPWGMGQALARKYQATGDRRYYADPKVAMLPIDALGFRRGAGAMATLLQDHGLADHPLFAQAKLRGIRALAGHASR